MSIDNQEKLEFLLDSLDDLKSELMMVVTQSRSEREISERILNISTKYKDIPEVFELIMFLNGILNLDIKNMKESIIKSIDTLITIKKASIRRIISLDARLHKIESLVHHLNSQCETHLKEDEETEENVISIFGMKINIIKVMVVIASIFIILFVAYSLNDKAASKAVAAITTTTEKVIEVGK